MVSKKSKSSKIEIKQTYSKERKEKLCPREAVPEPIKRIVRQDAGFGCCKCGLPIIQYHHIVPRSENPKDIMPLCPLCHDKASKGAMTEAQQLDYKVRPYNIIMGRVKGDLEINTSTPMIEAGSVRLCNTGDLIVVDGEGLLSLNVDDMHTLNISGKLYDSDNNLLVEIKDNEWISSDNIPWDIEADYQLLKIRRKKGKIILNIDTRQLVIKLTADLWRNGKNIHIDNNMISVGNKKSGISSLTLVGLKIMVDSAKDEWQIG